MVYIMKENLSKTVNVNILPEQYREIANAIGFENFYKLSGLLGGATWYIPTQKSLMKDAIHLNVINDFTGYNYKELAIKYDLSERTIRNIIKRDNDKK